MAYDIIHPDFAELIDRDAPLDRLFSGCLWAEGPVWLAGTNGLVWSDIPNDRMLFFDAATGTVSPFRQPSNFANGNTVDRDGRLVSCEHGGRRVVRQDPDGRLTVIADRVDGQRFNSPNDVVVKSDGSIWFTDPTYGIDSDYEGHKAASEIGACHVYRVDPASGVVTVVADDFEQPNGLAFSPDERLLYIVDSGSSHRPDGPRHIRRFSVTDDRRLVGGAVLVADRAAQFDGLRVDIHGHIWAGTADGVRCYAPDGTLIGRVLLPERAANLCFGGPARNRLYVTATTSLYAVTVRSKGAA